MTADVVRTTGDAMGGLAGGAVAVAGLTVSRMGGGLKSKGDGKGEEGGGSRRGPVENLSLYKVKSCE